MNYNQFYRKKDKYKRPMSPSEKENARKWGFSFLKSIGVGMVAGLAIILFYQLLS